MNINSKVNYEYLARGDRSQITIALIATIGIYIVAVAVPRLVFSDVFSSRLMAQGLEFLLSLLAILIIGKGVFSKYGFCWPLRSEFPSDKRIKWFLISLITSVLGIVSTVTILGLGGTGNPLLRQLTFPQILLFAIILAPINEELLMRGFFQSHLSFISNKYIKIATCRIELPVLISAVCFACMHLHIPFFGADAITTVTVFFFTLSVGLVAGFLRAKTKSLIPAIVAHVFANVGGMIGGIIFRVINQ